MSRRRRKDDWKFVVRLLMKLKVTSGYGFDVISTEEIIKDLLKTLEKGLYVADAPAIRGLQSLLETVSGTDGSVKLK